VATTLDFDALERAELQYLGVVSQLWEEACCEGLRQDADRFRAVLVQLKRDQIRLIEVQPNSALIVD
jgi:hypothetical protein